MTHEQIEAKALELYPDTEFVQYTNALARAAFIKGCQYAATPSGVSREEAEKDSWLEILHSNLVGRFVLPADRVRFEDWWAKATASFSAAQPVAGLQWVKASERLPESFKTVIVRNVNIGAVSTQQYMNRFDKSWGVGLDNLWQKDNTEWLDEQK